MSLNSFAFNTTELNGDGSTLALRPTAYASGTVGKIKLVIGGTDRDIVVQVGPEAAPVILASDIVLAAGLTETTAALARPDALATPGASDVTAAWVGVFATVSLAPPAVWSAP